MAYVTITCKDCGREQKRWHTAIVCLECARKVPTAKQRARNIVARAVNCGELPRLDGDIACVDCGKPAKHYDHRDYLYPLFVQPVCRSCNARRGAGINGDLSQDELKQASRALKRKV